MADKTKQAEQMIREVFGDTSVSQAETIDRLGGLRDLLNELIETLEDEMDD